MTHHWSEELRVATEQMASETAGRWQAIGGREGGTVAALAFSPNYTDDQTILAATLAGVHRSTDAGQSWHNVSQGLPNPFVDALAFSPDFARDRIVYAGGRESGVSRSTDGGETWQAMSFWSRTPPSIAALVVSPTFSSDATVFAGAEDGRVYRSTNAGRTWDSASAGLGPEPIMALAISHGFGGDTTLFAASTNGLYVSHDHADSWEPGYLHGLVIQTIALSPSFEMDQTIFVGTEEAGVLRSTDGGVQWVPMNEGLTDRCVNALALSPGFAIDGIALAATAGGVFRTEDSGATWTSVGDVGSALCVAVPPPPTRHDFDLEQHRVTLAGTAQGGIFRSSDGGQTWAEANQGLAARLLVTLVISPNFTADQTLFACGLEEGVQRSVDGGHTWQQTIAGLDSLEVAGLAVSPAFATDRVVVAATAAGIALSRDGGDSWYSVGGPIPAQAVALAPGFSGVGAILAGGPRGDVHLSSDGGLTWRPLDAPFLGEELATLAFSPNYGKDTTLLAATSRPGADDADARTAVWWSTDDGATWEAALQEKDQTRWVSLAVPPTFERDGGFFVGIANRVVRPMRNAVESRGGRRPIWTGERPGGPRATVVHLALSPHFATDQTLFTATSAGVYVSRTGGRGWRPLRDGMTDRSIVAVALSPAYADDRLVFAASLGGAIWRLRDA
jgi:photosystem II stability/assembly factor-like uncharacterized protein